MYLGAEWRVDAHDGAGYMGDAGGWKQCRCWGGGDGGVGGSRHS